MTTNNESVLEAHRPLFNQKMEEILENLKDSISRSVQVRNMLRLCNI